MSSHHVYNNKELTLSEQRRVHALRLAVEVCPSVSSPLYSLAPILKTAKEFEEFIKNGEVS